MTEERAELDLAIVGMSCRFPGAPNPGAFWRNLVAGAESITRFTPAELLAAGVPATLLERADYVPAAPVLDEPDRFDAGFFGYQPGEAAALDPQHRLLLELAQEALEDAGCDPEQNAGRRIGVFAGAALNTYFVDRGQAASLVGHYIPTLLAADKDFLATRVSYKLGLSGPSLTVQSACSTGLVAVHLARQSLLGRECDLALAAAVAVRVPHRAGYLYDGSGVVSPDGRVRPFGAGANGTVFGSGGGVVVLKRLEDAQADGDRIYAVIRGSAINNDGADKAGYSAPSVSGQADVVIEALANAGLSAEEISYLEAHGSGTPVGDRIEALALTRAFREFSARSGFCALGSVKGNIGHLDAAAGIAGLIKTVLALHHHRIPATLHAEEPNPEIDFAASPFRLSTAGEDWPRGDRPRRAGVMATGMGGTNAHVVLEEAPATTAVSGNGDAQLFVLSARSPAALTEATLRFGASIDGSNAPTRSEDIAATLQSGRRAFRFRRAAVAASAKEAAAQLAGGPDAGAFAGEAEGSGPAVAFLLPGVGDQYVGMGRGLYQRFPAFREAVDDVAVRFAAELGCDLRTILYPAAGDTGPVGGGKFRDLWGGAAGDPAATPDWHRTRFSQPLLFLFEYALARLWQSAGVTPSCLIGHSLGEWVAACLSGVFSLPEAVRLVALRARLVDRLPLAALTAVMLSEDELRPLLPRGVHVSLLNGPRLCVVAGSPVAMESLRGTLHSRGVVHRAVRGAHPFHTAELEPIANEFRAALRSIRFGRPGIPFASNVTGNWITPEQACDPEYWVRHACSPARFTTALERLWELPDVTLLELGPGRTLGVLAFQHPARGARKPLSLGSVRADFERRDDGAYFLETAGRLWVRGAPLQWDRLRSAPARKVGLPTYPFQRDSHWLSGAATGSTRPDLLLVPQWERQRPLAGRIHAAAPERAPERTWCFVMPREGGLPLAGELQRLVAERGDAAVFVAAASDWPAVLAAQRAAVRNGALRIVHLGALAAGDPEEPAGGAALERAFHDPARLVQALAEMGPGNGTELTFISRAGHDITGTESIAPAGAMTAALAAVVRREYPDVAARAIDVDDTVSGEALLEEIARDATALLVGLRGRHRWIRTWRAARASETAPRESIFREGGVYLITGGTGGIGLEVAAFLARSFRAHVVLASRHPGPAEPAARQIAGHGGSVEVEKADVTDTNAMRDLAERIRRRHGALHGIFHAAGIQRDGMLELKTKSDLDTVLAPKTDGAAALYQAVGRWPLDFVVLFSSLSSVVGYHGQADYAAANAFLDGMAAWANARCAFPTVAINWSTWEGVGMARRQRAARVHGIRAADGIEALRRALALGHPQIAVSPLSWEDTLAQAALVAPLGSGATGPERPPATWTDGAGPRDDVERTVASIWDQALGSLPRSIDEDFLSAGGHSLLAMRIVAQIRAVYAIDFTLRQFFAAPTIAGNAAAIQDAVLAEVESLSEEEAGRRSA